MKPTPHDPAAVRAGDIIRVRWHKTTRPARVEYVVGHGRVYARAVGRGGRLTKHPHYYPPSYLRPALPGDRELVEAASRETPGLTPAGEVATTRKDLEQLLDDSLELNEKLEAEVARLLGELADAKRVCDGLAERVATQGELLSRFAEKGAGKISTILPGIY